MFKVDLIPAFQDNYLFLVALPDGKNAIVDPGDAAPVIEWLDKENKTLDYILITHHHADHIGGVNELKDKYNAQIIGFKGDQHRLPPLDKAVSEGQILDLGGADIRVIETPGHTLGHICYHFTDHGCAFVGDTLFVMGCGRLFEGSAQQMWQSLEKLCALPKDTRLYCAHEYTLANARFALSAFPNNPDIISAENSAKQKRETNSPTVPTTIEQELKSNPFLLAKNAEEFAKLRLAKDQF